MDGIIPFFQDLLSQIPSSVLYGGGVIVLAALIIIGFLANE
ncbi:hypothetical protein [Staphylococcus saprophyticus]|nr:hypothetical protein [Staphylococcus saprophyticus]